MSVAAIPARLRLVPDEQLTEREQAAALLLAYGNTNRDVARELNVSVRTVESERARLMRKLGFARRSDLVRWALERGLLHRGAVAGNPNAGSAPATMGDRASASTLVATATRSTARRRARP